MSHQFHVRYKGSNSSKRQTEKEHNRQDSTKGIQRCKQDWNPGEKNMELSVISLSCTCTTYVMLYILMTVFVRLLNPNVSIFLMTRA